VIVAIVYLFAFISFYRSEHEYYLGEVLGNNIIISAFNSDTGSKDYESSLQPELAKRLSDLRKYYFVKVLRDANNCAVLFVRTDSPGFFDRFICLRCFITVRSRDGNIKYSAASYDWSNVNPKSDELLQNLHRAEGAIQ
jgi:hypothetical protein